MENPVLIFVIVGVVAAIGGYLFGMLDSKVTQKITKKDEPEVQVVPEISAMSVVFDGDQHIIVKMEGKPVSPETLTPAQREILRKIVFQMRPYVVETPGSESAPTPAVQPAPAPPPAPVSPPSSLKIKAEAIPADIASSANYVFRQKPIAPAITASMTMIEQIDQFLQAHLEGTPLEARKIAMRDGPDHSVQVLVGNEVFNGVANVPYPEVQAVIREAIAAWEKKHG